MRCWRQARTDLRATPTRRLRAVFLCLSLSRSRPPEQAKKQTNRPQTRANAGLRALNVQEGRREKQRQRGRKRLKTGVAGTVALKRQIPETAPTLALRAKKIPTDKGWDFGKWWRWAELNRRPKALHPRHYMLSSPLNLAPGQHGVQSASRNQPALSSLELTGSHPMRFRDDDPTQRARTQAVSGLRP